MGLTHLGSEASKYKIVAPVSINKTKQCHVSCIEKTDITRRRRGCIFKLAWRIKVLYRNNEKKESINIRRPPSLSELTLYHIWPEFTHFESETSKLYIDWYTIATYNNCHVRHNTNRQACPQQNHFYDNTKTNPSQGTDEDYKSGILQRKKERVNRKSNSNIILIKTCIS